MCVNNRPGCAGVAINEFIRHRHHPRVCIVVLNWNQRDLTLDCLESLGELEYPPDRLQIIVVDNGSDDGTALAVRQGFPSVTVLENDDNLGFAEGNNVGIRHAMALGTDYVMLLNNDTVVDPAMLTALLDVAQRNSNIGIVGPKMLYFDPPDVIWCAGNRVDWETGGLIRLRADQADTENDEPVTKVDYITGCGICLRREVIEEIGLLDPRFFIYYEETDWCLRAHKGGWQVLCVPRARLWHKVSAAMGTQSPATDYYMARNRLLFIAKHQQGLCRIRLLVKAAARTLLTVAAYAFKPHGGRRTPNRNARLLGLRDAILGRWGKMGPDVEAICYPCTR